MFYELLAKERRSANQANNIINRIKIFPQTSLQTTRISWACQHVTMLLILTKSCFKICFVAAVQQTTSLFSFHSVLQLSQFIVATCCFASWVSVLAGDSITWNCCFKICDQRHFLLRNSNKWVKVTVIHHVSPSESSSEMFYKWLNSY